MKLKRFKSNMTVARMIMVGALLASTTFRIAQAQVASNVQLCSGGGQYLAGARVRTDGVVEGACAACPRGTYSPSGDTTSVSCKECEPGYYSGWGAAACTECPAGWKCQNPTTILPTPCGKSEYSPAGSTSCFACLAGMYCGPDGDAGFCVPGEDCPGGSSVYPEPVPCQAGYKCDGVGTKTQCSSTSGSATYSAEGSSQCTLCPPGYACPNAAHPPIQCPAGYYNTQYGQNTCSLCPTGHYCPSFTPTSTDLVQHPIACAPGFYAPKTGYSACLECSAGHKCDRTTMEQCPDGYYAPAGSDMCYPCPPGYSCNSATRDAPTECASTEYSLGVELHCHPCPVGYECLSKKTRPLKCKPGYYSAQNTNDCTECPVNNFCADPTRFPSPCPQGTSSDAGSIECTGASAGIIIDYDVTPPASVNCTDSGEITNQDGTACISCPAGYTCPDGLYGRMLPCSPGYYSLVDELECTVSPPGKYAPRTDEALKTIGNSNNGANFATFFADIGMTYVKRCPVGHYCPDLTGRHISSCPPGYYTKEATTVCTQCEAGKYCPQALGEQLFAGIVCVDGTYSDVGWTECLPCKPGYDCSAKTLDDMTACNTGEFQLGGSKTCTTCPANHECSDKTQNDHTGKKPMGQTIVRCPAFHYMDPASDDGDCKPCPDGSECQGVALPENILTYGDIKFECQAGYYSRALDLMCMPCPAGHYCENAGTAVPTICAGGTWSGEGAATCTACLSGFYAKQGSAYCTPVPPGFQIVDTGDVQDIEVCEQHTYSRWGEETCSACFDGFLCPQGSHEGSNWNNICPRGSFCIAGVEEKCPAGTFGIKYGAVSEADGCDTCPPGYNCQKGTAHFELVPCPKGGYCLEGAPVVPCPAGTFNDNIYGRSLGDCKTCPSGHLCEINTVDRGAPCPEGYYCPRGGAVKYACPAGTHGASRTNKKDLSECLPCPPGHYCEEASGSPTPAPIGYYTMLSGIPSLASLYKCPPGNFCPNQGMTSVEGYVCAAGHVCPQGSTSQTEVECPDGTFSDVRGLFAIKDCEMCPKGYVCAAGIDSTGMVPCSQEEYCPPGTGALENFYCPAGKYAPYTAAMSAEDCLPCPPGDYCSGSGTAKQPCTKGNYCPEGTSVPVPCPIGYYGDDTGFISLQQCRRCGAGKACPILGSTDTDVVDCKAGFYNDVSTTESSCHVCPAGFYCPDASNVYPVPCDKQTYSAAGASACILCPAGTYCPDEGISDLTLQTLKCPKGTFCSVTYAAGTIGGITYPSDVLNVGIDTYPNKKAIADGGHACPQFKYCPEGTTEPIDIPEGTMQQTYARGGGDEAIQTPRGFYHVANPSGDAAVVLAEPYILTACPVGFYCPAGRFTDKIPCPIGTFRDTIKGQDVSHCGLCPSGTYCPTEGTHTPTDCDAGNFCPQGSVLPQKCPIGTYDATGGLRDSRGCTPCDEGHYCPLMGQTAVSKPTHECDAGFYCIAGSSRPEPTDNTTGKICPIGGYCEQGTLTPSSCVGGEYGPYIGAKSSADCHTCLAGNYCPGGSAEAAIVTCEARYYCPTGSITLDVAPVVKSQPGHYAQAGQAIHFTCERGYYQDQEFQSSCLTCPAGVLCDEAGLDNKPVCPLGYYCPSYLTFTTLGEDYIKKPCPRGKYGATESLVSESECLLCPAGEYCDEEAMEANVPTQLCSAGYYCTQGSPYKYPWTDVPGNYGPCPAGHWCGEGTVSAYQNPCAAGTYNPQERATSVDFCIPCPPGYLCIGTGNTAPTKKCDAGTYCSDGLVQNDCAATSGQYCPLNTYHPQWCPFGLYQDATARGYCKMCSAGNFCMTGTTSACNQGYFCPNDLSNA